MHETINLARTLGSMPDHWRPRVIARVNDAEVKLVRMLGEFVWHHHEHEDELFLVVRGRLLMKFRDRDVWLEEGECLCVPHGVEHCPVAPEEVHVLLFEPGTTVNTGNVTNDRTVPAESLSDPDRTRG